MCGSSFTRTMTTSILLASFLLLTLTATPLHSKTVELKENKSPTLISLFNKELLARIRGNIQSNMFVGYKKGNILQTIMSLFDNGLWMQMKEDIQSQMNLASLKNVLTSDETLKSLLTKKVLSLDVFKDLVNENRHTIQPILKLAAKMKKMKAGSSTEEGTFGGVLETLYDNLIPEEMQIKLEEEETDNPSADIQNKLLQMAINVFEGKLNNLDSSLVPLTPTGSTSMSSLNSTYSSVWMVVKSTWQRLLAYVEDENSLETFMQLTPVRIIDNIISLGDDLNLMNFLAKKLDKDLAVFIAGQINPYLGPLQDFDTFYNFTKDNGWNNVIDYFTSDKFINTVNAMSRFISGYLEDTVSDDLVNQYIEFISFNNTELLNFYKSVLRSQGKSFSQDSTKVISNTNTTQRFKRDVLEDIASSYMQSEGISEQNTPAESRTVASRQLQQRFGALNPLGLTNSIYDPSRDGGYGGGGGGYGYGGGYGGGHGGYSMNTLDPYVILGSLALGTILGFLLFRALRGTGNGRRDIGDGSLSLWDSDLPQQVLPWGSSVQRMRRDVHDDTQGFSLPPSLRGDVWSSDPLVADNLLEDHLHEDDIAHHLNHLWRLYRATNDAACVHQHLCHVMANNTAQHVTGKQSGLGLVMASLSNMLGVVGSGQMMDDVTHSLVVGSPYTCPNVGSCHLI